MEGSVITVEPIPRTDAARILVIPTLNCPNPLPPPPPPPPPPAMLISTVVPFTANVLPAPIKFNSVIGPEVIVAPAEEIPILKPPEEVIIPVTSIPPPVTIIPDLAVINPTESMLVTSS